MWDCKTVSDVLQNFHVQSLGFLFSKLYSNTDAWSLIGRHMVFANPWEPFHPLGDSRFLRERKSFTNHFDFQYSKSIWCATCVQNLCKKIPLLCSTSHNKKSCRNCNFSSNWRNFCSNQQNWFFFCIINEKCESFRNYLKYNELFSYGSKYSVNLTEKNWDDVIAMQ